MLVRINTDRLNLVLPIPYFLLVQAMEAVADLLWIGEKLMPSSINRLCLDHRCNQGGARFSRENCLQTSDLRLAVRMAGSLINELRQYGKWRMVEVVTAKSQVFVDFI